MTLIATATASSVEVYSNPSDEEPRVSFPNPWFVNEDPTLPVPLVLVVKEQRTGGWLEVLLPIRPNGSTGWIRAKDVVVTSTGYRITVELGAHRLRVFDGTRLVVEDTIAVGAPATPTPTGQFYIRALLKAPDPKTVYGPYAYALSGFSETLETFNGGDAELGIHGNNDAAALGSDVTHGCVRMSNPALRALTMQLPLGTPVLILP